MFQLTYCDINEILFQKPKPPSYEEVVEADLNAFIGEMKAPRVAPRIPIRPRPPVPSNAHAPKLRLQSVSQNKPPQQAATDMLIDFNDSPVIMPSNTKDVSTPNKQSLLDLDDIFSCNGYDTSYVTPLQTNGARSSKTNDFSDLTSNKQGLGPRVLPPGPVPAPQRHGTSLLNSSNTNDNTLSSRGEVWLQSCLMGTTNVDFGYSQSALSEKSQNVDTFMNGHR